MLHVQVIGNQAEEMMQGAKYLVNEIGANFVAPYVNRLDNVAGEGTRVVKAINKLGKSFHKLITYGFCFCK